MRHQIVLRQYNPNKPVKYGLLYKLLNDARFPYKYQVTPYRGKLVDGNAPYYLNATEDYVKHVVESMPASSMKGKNISMDRLYGSISTSFWLVARNITSICTLVFLCLLRLCWLT